MTTEVPELRIIDDETRARVQARLGEIRAAAGADDPDPTKFWEKRRSSYILTGKVFCASCGGALSNIGRDYLACSAARRQEVCTNRRGIRRQAFEDLVLDAMRTRLMEPALVEAFIQAFTFRVEPACVRARRWPDTTGARTRANRAQADRPD